MKIVFIKTEDNKTIKSDYLEYNKSTGFLKLRKNIEVRDSKNNTIKTENAEYFENKKVFKSIGPTEVITSENFIIEGKDIIFDNNKKFINSNNNATLTDNDKNKIYLENFEYLINENIFKSIGLVKVEDVLGNVYEFSQIYIDTKKKEILGTDIKAFINQEGFKINEQNKPRIFANSFSLNKKQSEFNKSVFTICDYRENDKCPPWTIQAKKMLHDNKKKTIYYNNAIVKVFDIPIFYFPKLSHPDPTVDRRSGFLPPTSTNSKNLGSGVFVPYFFDLGLDKNLVITNRIYATEHPLFLGEFHQALNNANLFADFGYTEGYKKTTSKKKEGNKSHFFGKFEKNFIGKNNSNNNLTLNLQDVSNDKYLKLYKIESNLVNFNRDTLENSIDFTHEKDDLFLKINASVYETMKEGYNDKYEYILPEIIFNKNLFNNDTLGNLDLETNFKVHNYDTNRLTSFVVNDFNWSSKDIFLDSGLKTQFLGNLKNINYEAKNVDIYKDDTTNELFGAFGLATEMNLQKYNGDLKHILKPKLLLRHSPGNMRKETASKRLDPLKAFSLNRLVNSYNYETGTSGTLGFEYKIDGPDRDFDFSVAQVINQKENKKMNSKTGMDEKLSDLVGSASLDLKNKFSLNYNFALDQNYNDMNFSEIGATTKLGPFDLDFNYLLEQKHIGDQDYFKTKVNFNQTDKSLFSFETKRNLITNSSEFYNLSYEYFNDCLRAGLVYRREFYTDSELEPENSLMFKITLTPFGT